MCVDGPGEPIEFPHDEDVALAQHRLEEQNRRLRQVTTDVLALARELRNSTINRIIETSDLELGLQALLGNLPPRRP